MKKKMPLSGKMLLSFAFIGFSLLTMIGCQKAIDQYSARDADPAIGKPAQMLKNFRQVNLVGSDDEYSPTFQDAALINGWGIAFSSGGTAWVSSQGGGVSTVYNKDGVKQAISPVAIPSPGGPSGGNPTGQVFNSSTDFKLSTNNNPARFIFVGLDGIISGWNGGAAAIKMVARTGISVYTGLAIGSSGGNNYLYAADFKSGKIDVFDKNWAMVNTMSFMDPDLPAGYSPFNIQALGGKLYVMYAEVGPDGRDVKHPGAGYVDVYNTDGSFVKRLISRGQLNAPWGIAIAPASFFANEGVTEPTVLVGNFGDGTINAYTMDGVSLGQLRASGEPIVIEGLWAISFAPATATAVNPNWLYFAAGPEEETAGLFGYITKP